jgi:hypothetical protein
MHGMNLLTMLYYGTVVTAVGKPAIDKYWRNRRANVLKLSLLRMKFGWVKVNKAEKYKNPGNFFGVGTKLRLNTKEGIYDTRIHTVFHFDKMIKSMW